MWPGEFVDAHLVLRVVKNGITVAAGAAQMGATGPFVYAVQDNSTVAAQRVTVTEVESGTALIGKGLKAGDNVVVSGQTNLSPGVKVAIKTGLPRRDERARARNRAGGVGSTGINTAPFGLGRINPR